MIAARLSLTSPQRAVEGAEFVVAHGAPHLIDATARQEKEAVIDELHGSIRELIGHGGHRRQLKPSPADGLDRVFMRLYSVICSI